MSVKVKFCGITSIADARGAEEAGADMIGLVFYAGSPRYVSLENGAQIATSVSPFVLKVGVFVNPEAGDVVEAVRHCGLNMLQFHGEESPEFCTQFGVMSMKAFRIRDAGSLRELEKFPTDAWLLDAYSKAGLGGTGESFNWELAVEAGKAGKPIFLAGGLTPENVGDAVRLVRPFAVDVSSGVESAPGKKDAGGMQAFIKAVRAAENTGRMVTD
jgi:phosphoribosylanthranilate isomerase